MTQSPVAKRSKLDRFLSNLSSIAAIISMSGLMIVVVITVIDVLMRWLFNSPVHGAKDIGDAALVLIVAGAFVASTHGSQHITIRFLGRALGPRTNRVLDRFGEFMLLAFMAAIAWQLSGYSAEIAEEGRTTWVLGLPLWPWWYGASALMAICVLLLAANIFVGTDDSDAGH